LVQRNSFCVMGVSEKEMLEIKKNLELFFSEELMIE
jgi:hypothetical protein